LTFEALDRTLKDIVGYKNPNKALKLFGGKTTLLGGDFRQILPVIQKGKRKDIVQTCIVQCTKNVIYNEVFNELHQCNYI
jgi:endonuclease IV